MRRQTLVSFALLLLLAFMALAFGPKAARGQQPEQEEPPSIELRFLANEGFLIRSQGAGVYIDAFVAEPFSIYGEVPAEILTEMMAGGAPFQGVRAALVSHHHRDHFQPDVAALFLNKHRTAQLVSSPQVVKEVRMASPRLAEDTRLIEVLPEPGEFVEQQFGNFKVEFFTLPHGGARHGSIQNLGHIIHVSGQRILHIGDATVEAAAYEAFDLPGRKIDMAIIPYWFFEDDQGQETIRKHLHARHVVAAHIPVKDAQSIRKRLRQSHPHVHILETPMQFLRF